MSIFTPQAHKHWPFLRFFSQSFSVVLSLHGILFLSVAVSIIEPHCSREAAFFHSMVLKKLIFTTKGERYCYTVTPDKK